MHTHDWFTMTPQTAQAFGRPTNDGFLIRAGSTAMISGSPNVKRDKALRDRLLAEGVLRKSGDPALYLFSRDHLFKSPSAAGGIVKDGNCSGPGAWKRLRDGRSLRALRYSS